MLSALFVSYAGVLGGGERILVDLVSRLPDCDAAIACPEGDLASAARDRGVRVVPVRGHRLELRGSARDRLAAAARLGGHTAEVRGVVARQRPDVLVAWGTRSALACTAALRTLRPRPPLIQQGNDLLTGPLIARAARAAARRADLVVSLSETIARDLDPANALGDRRVVVNPGVDLESYAGLDAPPPKPHALVLSAIVDWKRPLLAVEAVALAARALPDLELTIAGAPLDARGELLADELRRRAAEPDLAGRVHLPGAVPDVRAALGRASCLLHCADCEPFGMALVEALAAGRPVAAPASCGPQEIVTAECGRLFAPGDAQGAADALAELHVRRELPAELGAAGRRRAEELYRIEDSVARYRDVLERAAR